MTKEWLLRGMLKSKNDASSRVDIILKELVDHSLTLSHARHLSAK